MAPKKGKEKKKENEREWTVMVYLAGDNNLAEEMLFSLKCMHLVGSDNQVPSRYDVVALYDAGFAPVTFRILPHNAQGAFCQTEDYNLLAKAEGIRHVQAEDRVDEAGHKERSVRLAFEKIEKQLQHPKYAGTVAAKKGKKGPTESRKELKEKLREAEADLEAAKAAREGGAQIIEPIDVALTRFVEQTIRDYPAKRYMLVLSGHGSGAVGDFLTSNKRLFSLTIPGLRQVLSNVQAKFRRKDGRYQPEFSSGKIEILGLDSCLMSMAEVAYEVRDYVHYMIGAEGFEANTGWPYDRILSLLRTKPARNGDEFAKAIVREYIDYYRSDYALAEVSTDQAALDLSNIDDFIKALGRNDNDPQPGLSKLLSMAFDKREQKIPRDEQAAIADAVILAHWYAQGYKNEQQTDLLDFCELLGERCKNIGETARHISEACGRVAEAARLTNLVLYSDYSGPAFQYSHGLSIFFPWAKLTDAAGVSDLEHYSFLEFAHNTHWDEFLAAYHDYTQREPKHSGGRRHFTALNRREGLFFGKPAGKAGTDSSSKAGTDSSSKAGTDSSSKAGTDSSSKAGTDSSSKAGTDSSSKAGTDSSSKGGTGTGTKIASMKNPPIVWFSQ